MRTDSGHYANTGLASRVTIDVNSVSFRGCGRPRLCEECYRRLRGKKTTDAHHIAGKSNSPVTIEVRANDHRAALSLAQYNWPPGTLENRDGSPLLCVAALLRGVCDIIVELFVPLMLVCATKLEELDAFFRGRLGPTWWRGTPFDGWQPQ